MNKKKLSQKEIKQEEIFLLEKVIEFLNKEKIEYYVFAGTFLGCIRHKGFIPWDDDIDLAIPRHQYNKLIKKLNNYNIIFNDISAIGFELGNSDWPFIKFIKNDVKVEVASGCDKNIWVDIFPLDGVPQENTKKYYKKIKAMHRFFIWLRYSNKKQRICDSNYIKSIIKKIIFSTLKFIPYEKYIRYYINYCSKYDIKDCMFVCNNVWGIGEKEKLLKDKLIISEYKFENLTVNGFKDYNYILTSLYGDYMTLPPKEKRISHEIIAWKEVDKNEKNKI